MTLNGARAKQKPKKITLSVIESRPVASIVSKLEVACGCVITYEDPTYEHYSEIADVTETVRRDLDQYPPGKAPRVLIPKPDLLTIEYDPLAAKRTDGIVAILQQVLDAQAARRNAGRFRLETDRQTIHVVPAFGKNAAGALVRKRSLLDTVIALPPEERTGKQTLEAICAAVGELTGTRVMTGTIPLNPFLRDRQGQEINSGKARDVLSNLLETLQGANKLSWRLLYDPGVQTFVLNIHQVVTSK